jgi:hypothetical protein
LSAFNTTAVQADKLELAHGGELFYFALSENDQFYLDAGSFGMSIR